MPILLILGLIALVYCGERKGWDKFFQTSGHGYFNRK